MLTRIKDVTLRLIGDPHLGKLFKTGVPLNRLGEREAMQWDDMRASLDVDCDLNVCMGDVFDRYIVPPEIVLRLVDLYLQAAARRPKTQFILLRGNHDASRDADKASSFDLLTRLLGGVSNLRVVRQDVFIWSNDHLHFGFFPWHPFISAAEMAASVDVPLDAAFGHWDIDTFGGSDHNLVPVKSFLQPVPVIYTGHVHLPSERHIAQSRVVVTGSLQPYSHAEDLKGELYVTLPLAAVQEQKDALKYKNVRVLLQPDEVLDFEIDCLSLTTKRVDEAEAEEALEVEFDNFDIGRLFKDVFTEFGVSDETAAKVYKMYEEKKIS